MSVCLFVFNFVIEFFKRQHCILCIMKSCTENIVSEKFSLAAFLMVHVPFIAA